MRAKIRAGLKREEMRLEDVDLMLVYDVWIDDVHVGRMAERWGESALDKRRNVRCLLVTAADGKLVRV